MPLPVPKRVAPVLHGARCIPGQLDPVVLEILQKAPECRSFLENQALVCEAGVFDDQRLTTGWKVTLHSSMTTLAQGDFDEQGLLHTPVAAVDPEPFHLEYLAHDGVDLPDLPPHLEQEFVPASQVWASGEFCHGLFHHTVCLYTDTVMLDGLWLQGVLQRWVLWKRAAPDRVPECCEIGLVVGNSLVVCEFGAQTIRRLYRHTGPVVLEWVTDPGQKPSHPWSAVTWAPPARPIPNKLRDTINTHLPHFGVDALFPSPFLWAELETDFAAFHAHVQELFDEFDLDQLLASRPRKFGYRRQIPDGRLRKQGLYVTYNGVGQVQHAGLYRRNPVENKVSMTGLRSGQPGRYFGVGVFALAQDSYQGIMFANSKWYVGRIRANCLHGPGLIIAADGQQLLAKGHFVNSRLEGPHFGLLWYPSGQLHKMGTNWRGNCLSGPGTGAIFYPNGQLRKQGCNWTQDCLDGAGHGMLFHPSGSPHAVGFNWCHDALHGENCQETDASLACVDESRSMHESRQHARQPTVTLHGTYYYPTGGLDRTGKDWHKGQLHGFGVKMCPEDLSHRRGEFRFDRLVDGVHIVDGCCVRDCGVEIVENSENSEDSEDSTDSEIDEYLAVSGAARSQTLG